MLGAVAGMAALPAQAADIMVLTKAEPGLSQTGRSIWTCTYVNGDRVLTVVRETSCPPSTPTP